VISTRPKLQKLSPPRGIQKLQLGSARADGAEAVVELTGTDAREVGLKVRSLNPTDPTKRRVFARLSIAVGNALQIGGILAAYFALRTSRFAHSSATAVITPMVKKLIFASEQGKFPRPKAHAASRSLYFSRPPSRSLQRTIPLSSFKCGQVCRRASVVRS